MYIKIYLYWRKVQFYSWKMFRTASVGVPFWSKYIKNYNANLHDNLDFFYSMLYGKLWRLIILQHEPLFFCFRPFLHFILIIFFLFLILFEGAWILTKNRNCDFRIISLFLLDFL